MCYGRRFRHVFLKVIRTAHRRCRRLNVQRLRREEVCVEPGFGLGVVEKIAAVLRIAWVFRFALSRFWSGRSC